MVHLAGSDRWLWSLWGSWSKIPAMWFTHTPISNPSRHPFVFLENGAAAKVRKETLRVLGLLGALDPYKHKVNIGMIKVQQDTGVALICITENRNEDTSEMTTSEMLVNMNYSSLEEFYPACAIAVLMKVIKDPTLVQHQHEVVRAVTFIFKSLGVKGVPYLSRVIPSLLHVIYTSDVSFRDSLFKQLSTIIDIVKQHIRTYLDDIVQVLKRFWKVTENFENTSTIITVVESIATAVGNEFKMYLKDLVPMILKSFINDTKEKHITKKLLLALQKFHLTIDEYLHMLLPPVLKLFTASDVQLDVRRTAIETVDQFTEYLDLTDYVSQIIHPLLRTIETTPELRPTAMELLCSLATQLGRSYESFIPVVQRILNKHKIVNPRYDILVAKVVKGLTITEDEMLIVKGSRGKRESPSEPSMTIKKGTLSVEALQKAWSFNRLVSKDDWLEWLRRLSIELMKSSPSPALRACYSVATTYVQLSRDLFNAAFVSCWSELSESHQDDLLQSLKQALTCQDIPEITQTLLNLTEFMEHCEKGPLPLELQLLGGKAIECRAYAKALHYKEEEFHKSTTPQVLQSLISINTKLGQTEAAAGLLEFSRKNNRSDMKVQERWFEKLHDWEKALQAYEEKLKRTPEDTELALGQMRCLEALGEWGELYSVSCDRWGSIETLNEDCRRQMSRVASAAAWAMGQWNTMEKYANFIPRETQEGAFYRAVLAIHKNEFQNAQELIELSRELLDTELTAMVGESYQRAYSSMVGVQKLAELEEVIQFKLVPERRKAIAQIWWDRLQGCQKIVEDWQKILQVRSLVLSPQDDMRAWLKFASMCRKAGRLSLTHKTLVNLLGFDPSQNLHQILPSTHPRVTYQYCKYLYAFPSRRNDAFKLLHTFLKQLPPGSDAASQKLVSRVYLKLGLWHQELNGLDDKNVETILYYLKQSKDTDVNCYKAWHAFACTNFEALLLQGAKEDGGTVELQPDEWEDS
ncbi:UNVERIFIED_CONTAM: hypothetical protein GTU68_051307, partial [Idotea baltica]|nr:hypothetical protein [Idotea baltica]